MEYTTLSKLKAYLGITGSEFDGILGNVITRTTKQFDKYLGRNLEAKDYTEYMVLDGDDIAIVSSGPINSVVEVRFENDQGDIITPKRFDGSIIYFSEEIDGEIYVKYNAGFANMDDLGDVEQSCLEVCKDLWDNTPASGNEANIKSKQIETLSKSYFSKDEMAGGIGVSFRETLDNYKNFTPLIV